MEPSTGRTIAYTGNNAYDNTTNIYGNVHGDVHFPGASGQPGPYQCLRDLRVTDPRQDRARIEQEKDSLLKDCYAWVLEDPDFQRWRTQDDSHMLWIKGDPGKGKTMMTMGLIDELSRMDSEKQSSNMFSNMLTKLGLGSNPGRCLMAYFFCQNTRPELNNATSVLRGLIFLLVTEREELMRHVQKRYEAVGKQLFEGPNAIFALRGILSDILNDPSLPTTYLLVDALDECVYGLKDLLHIITDNKIMPGSRVKWLVTSRNIPEIERFLYSNTIGFKINLELNASHVSKAITAFINFKVDRLAGIQKYNIKTREEVQQQLYDKAEGTFLWVWLVCKELEGVPLYRTQFVLKELPPGLNPLYDRMMKHILAQKDADTVQFCKDILRSITLAYRPLHIKELAITADLPNKLFKEVQEVIDMVGHCGSFLTFQGSTVSFVHLSAKDYFLNGPGLHVFDGTVIQEHQRIASRLLDAIHIMLQRDICNFQNPGIRIQEAKSHIDTSVIPQIAYACEYWIDHLQTYVESNEDFLVDNGRVHTFLSEDILHWLEAMSFIQRMPEAVVLIRTLHSMFNKSLKSMSLDRVYDVLRFILWSGARIQEAPLQVYYSALVFVPRRSMIRQQFAQHIPEWIEVKSNIDEDWGSLLQTLEGHRGMANCVVFSPQGDRLASVSHDRTVRIWDTDTGQQVQTLQGHTDWVRSVAFSPQGDRLVSASDDHTIRLWDPNTGQLVQTLKGHTFWVNSVAFSPQGDRLASISEDSTVRLWDTNTGQQIRSMGCLIRVRCMAFSPQGDRIALVLYNDTIGLWDADTLQSVRTFKRYADGANSIAFSPQGDRLASASHDWTVRLWDTNTGQRVRTFRGHMGTVRSVAFSSQGDRLVSASEDRTVRLWDINTGRLVQTLTGHTGTVRSVAFSPQGDRLASAAEDCTVRLWGANANQQVQTPKGHRGTVRSVAFSPQGDRLASGSDDRTVQLWDTNTGQLVRTFKGHTNWVNSVAFSPQGDRLASGSNDRTVQLWDTNTGQQIRTFKAHTSWVNSVTFSPKGDRLASASDDRTVILWNADSTLLLQTLKGHTDGAMSVAFSPEGDVLASASRDGKARLWETKTGRLIRVLEGHTDRVMSVAFSPQGDQLASASYDRTVRLWDTKTGQLVHTIEGQLNAFESLAPSAFQPLSLRGQWVTYETKEMLWLPSQYAATCLAVYGNTIALGDKSGNILILSFTLPPPSQEVRVSA